MLEVILYTDGAARGNPNGPGGYGIVLKVRNDDGEEHEYEYSAGFKRTTNNRMELLAVIVGLEALKEAANVLVVSDSKYVTDAFNKDWISNWKASGWKTASHKPVKNPDLWMRLLKAMKNHNVTFKWVKGHDGHEENERCDKLATEAADKVDKK